MVKLVCVLGNVRAVAQDGGIVEVPSGASGDSSDYWRYMRHSPCALSGSPMRSTSLRGRYGDRWLGSVPCSARTSW